jgi:hypothetical protein
MHNFIETFDVTSEFYFKFKWGIVGTYNTLCVNSK